MNPGRIVSLPMYAAPDDSLERFWRGLRSHMLEAGLSGVPDNLARPDDLEAHWLRPDLLLSQTCGYPLVSALAGRVRYVGTPVYRAPGCEGAFYSSAILVRTDERATTLADMRGCRAAYNSSDSQSGYNGLLALVAPLAEAGRFFSTTLETGAHRASVRAVGTGAADLAAVDVVTFALLQRDHPDEVGGLRTLAFTAPMPGLPLITSAVGPPDEVMRLRASLTRALSNPALESSRTSLLLDGFEVLPIEAYAAIRDLRKGSIDLGYPGLA